MRFTLLLAVVLAVLLLPVIALAQAVIPDIGASPFGFVSALFDAVVAKNWTFVAALVTSALVFGVRFGLPRLPALVKKPEWAPKIDKVLKSDPMGYSLMWLAGFAVAMATASPAAFTWALCKQAAIYACGAGGVFGFVKKMAIPLVMPLAKAGLDWLTRKLGLTPGADIAAGIETQAAADAVKAEAAAKAGDQSAADMLDKIR